MRFVHAQCVKSWAPPEIGGATRATPCAIAIACWTNARRCDIADPSGLRRDKPQRQRRMDAHLPSAPASAKRTPKESILDAKRLTL